jgi:hypothetical protein
MDFVASPREIAFLRKINFLGTRWDTFPSAFPVRFRNECPTDRDLKEGNSFMITLCTCIAAIARFAAVTSSLATGRFAGGTEPLSNVRYVRWFEEHMLTASFTARDP